METGDTADRPRLAPHVRLSFDVARQQHTLLAPEAVVVVNETGAAIVGLCDGVRTVAQIQAELRGRYDQVADDDVRDFLAGLVDGHAMVMQHG